MISLLNIKPISSIYFTVTLLIYLIFIEFADEEVKKSFFPVIALMVAIFIIIAIFALFFTP